MTYEQLTNRAIGAAFILGPALLTLGAVLFALDVGRNPNDLDSYVEGVFAFYGMILFIPVFLTLAALIGRTRPRIGLVLAALGMGSAAGAVLPMATRVLQGGLTDEGVTYELWDLFEAAPVAYIVLLPSIFGLVAAAFGVALLVTTSVERYVGLLLIAAMPLFYVALAGGAAVEVTWTLATAMYVVALAPLGLRLIRGEELAASPARQVLA